MTDEKTVKKAAIAGATIGLVLLLCWFGWWRKPPQIGAEKEAVQVVDALFTAFTSRDMTRVAQCEEELHALRDGGKLPRPAAAYLDVLIRDARAGKWRPAAEQLFAFMKAQRRPNV